MTPDEPNSSANLAVTAKIKNQVGFVKSPFMSYVIVVVSVRFATKHGSFAIYLCIIIQLLTYGAYHCSDAQADGTTGSHPGGSAAGDAELGNISSEKKA